MTAPIVDLQELDATFARLHCAAEAIGTNLFELEADPTFAALDHSALVGTSLERWVDARRDLADVWQWFTRLSALLGDADVRRPAVARPDSDLATWLNWLVHGESIELGTERVPLAHRGLLTPVQSTVRCTPQALLDTMEDAFARVQAVVNDVAQCWDVLVPRLAAVRDELIRTRGVAASLDEDLPELDAAGGRLDHLAARMLADPVTVTEDEIAAAEHDVRALYDRVAAVAAVRDTFPARVDAARDALADLRDVEHDAHEAARLLEERLAARPHGSAPVSILRDLSGRLDELTGPAAALDWHTVDVSLADWHATAIGSYDEWLQYAAACRAPVARRDELRGRLDAYRVMANAHGMAEDLDAAAAYAAAHDALYRAPIDLDDAERRMRDYQDRLLPRREQMEEPR